jgi:Ca2+-binding EF-hand superfamily protein
MLKLYEAISELKGKDKAHAKAEVDKIFKQYDADKSGTLNKAEFVSAVQSGDVFSLFDL